MAAGTIATVLANVPWGQLMDLAPKLVEQAQKLTASVRSADPAPVPQAVTEIDELRSTVNGLLTDNADLRAELTRTTELLGALAKTNQTLVAKLALWQQWLWGLTGLSAASLVFALAAVLR